MIRVLSLALFAVSLAPGRLQAGEETQAELKQDVVLRAMVDELARNQEKLRLEDLKRPYFIEYAMNDSGSAMVTAKLGSITDRSTQRNRMLRADVRVGDYRLDNTNFQGDYSGFFFGGMGMGMGGASVPIEDDYAAIRQAIWWQTDRQYKSVNESLERKKAFMESKMIEDKPDDFSHESPSEFFEDRVLPDFDPADLEKIARPLSEVFRKYPGVQSSSASLIAVGGNKYLVNTEGSRVRQSGRRCSLTITATVQADDGMVLSDSINVYAKRADELPPLGELSDRCRGLAERLLKLKAAPKLDSYTGPVLFEALPAAQVFSQQFGPKFCGGQRPIGGQAPPDDFEKKLGERILPKFIGITDDPTQETLDGQYVLGHYTYDDQGIKARPVTLVEKGKLKALLMSRNPSKKFKTSTGHGRGPFKPATASGCLVVSAAEGEDADSLKKLLLEACKEENLEFGVRVASLGSAGENDPFSRFAMFAAFSDFGGRRGMGTTPLEMYKVYPDGREELVRGAEISKLDLKAFKKIKAAGDKACVYNSGGMGAPGRTIAAPALLFEELDFAKIDKDFDKPPIIESPLARGDSSAEARQSEER